MSGLDEILNIISEQQKESEEKILSAARLKAEQIQTDAETKASKAYEDYLVRANAQHERDYENSCSSVDAEIKRRLLTRRVELIDKAVEKTLSKLRALPDDEYFALLIKMLTKHIRAEEGTLYLGRKDLDRLPGTFESEVKKAAEKAGGALSLSEAPADIEDGFILEYGLISENCSFEAVLDAEKEGIRDTAARHLFG